MERYDKQNGSITIKAADGKIIGNLSGRILQGPGDTVSIVLDSAPAAPTSGSSVLIWADALDVDGVLCENCDSSNWDFHENSTARCRDCGQLWAVETGLDASDTRDQIEYVNPYFDLGDDFCDECGLDRDFGHAIYCSLHPDNIVDEPLGTWEKQLILEEALDEARTNGESLMRRDGQRRPLEDVLAPYRGKFADGYDEHDVVRLLSEVIRETGIEIVCVWDRFDDGGFGGDSDWYIVIRDRNDNATLHELCGNLWSWANEPADSPDCPITLEDPASWRGRLVDADPQEWDGYNWPLTVDI